MEAPRISKLAQTLPKLDLLIWPDPKLNKICDSVTEFDSKLTQLVVDITQAMQKHDGAGLAANQVGILKRIIVYRAENAEGYMINPEILASEGETYEAEQCLSFPGVFIKVKRAAKIEVKFQDDEGTEKVAQMDGFLAKVIQHEIEHLDGITFVRYLSTLKRDVVTRKMKKVRKRVEARRKQLRDTLRPDSRDEQLVTRV
jgi:peptide deformylase